MSNNIYTIYKVTNKINGKSYIGFDSNWPNRKRDHLINAFYKKSLKFKFKFYNAIRKYGKDNFDWEIISQSKDGIYLLKEMEPYFIKEHNTFGEYGYNMTLGGEGRLGHKHNQKTIEKMRKSSIGRKHTEETKKKMSLSRKGKKLSLIHKINIGLGNKGKIRSKEFKKELIKMKSKNYIVINPLGTTYKIKNLKKFSLENNLNQSHMVQLAKGKGKYHKGWKCMFVYPRTEFHSLKSSLTKECVVEL